MYQIEMLADGDIADFPYIAKRGRNARNKIKKKMGGGKWDL